MTSITQLSRRRLPDDQAFGEERRVGTRVGLPTGRAIAGGLLVAVSALGIFAAHRSATATDLVDYLMVRSDIAAGSVIDADDLALAPMDLYPDTAARAITDPDEVIGRVALVAMAPGDLVLTTATAESVDEVEGTGRRLGLSLDAQHALGGDLAAGGRVDVVSIPQGESSSEVIVRGALVGSVSTTDDLAVGSMGELQVILDLPDEEAARRVVDAHAKGGITLISRSAVTFDVAPTTTETP